MNRIHRSLALLATAIAAGSLAACAPAGETGTALPPRVETTASAPMLSAEKAQEAFGCVTYDYDPYGSPAELAESATAVVEGRVEGFQAGREITVTGTETPLGATMVMVISGATLVGGDDQVDVADTVYVELHPACSDSAEWHSERVPSGTSVLVFLTPAWDGSDPLDESLTNPAQGRPAGEPLWKHLNPQSLVFSAGDDLIWPMTGGQITGKLSDAHPNGTAITF